VPCRLEKMKMTMTAKKKSVKKLQVKKKASRRNTKIEHKARRAKVPMVENILAGIAGATAWGSPIENKYMHIDLDHTRPHPLQPPFRALKERVNDLLKTIGASRRFDAPVLLEIPGEPGFYWVVNGNRRITVAKLLGQSRLQCCILPAGTNPTEAWLHANAAARQITGVEALTAIAATTSAQERNAALAVLVQSRHGLANQIQKMGEILGWSTAMRLGRTGVHGPNRVTRFKQLVKFGREFGFAKVEDKAFQRKMLLWFYTFDTYREVGDTIRYFERSRGETFFAKVWTCIEKDKTYQLEEVLDEVYTRARGTAIA